MTTLLANLLPRELLSDLLCGQLVTRWRVPSGWAQVLKSVLGHLGRHSNRVWAGVDCLAAEASVSASTVKRALRFFRETLKIRVVSPGELARNGGPGPQQFTGEKRGENDTACYDLSSLLRFVPTALIHRFSTTSQANVSSSCCDVVEEKGKELRPQRAENDPAAGLRAGAFLRSNLTDRKEEGIAADAADAAAGPGYRALRERGVWPGVAAAIVRDKGEDWARRLAFYARWQEKPVGAGWIQRTWKGFDSWPDWFTEKWNREQAAAARHRKHPFPSSERTPRGTPCPRAGCSTRCAARAAGAAGVGKARRGSPAGSRRGAPPLPAQRHNQQ